MFWGSDFRRLERNFTIGQSPKIWGNFSKICIKICINKNLEKLERKFEKMQISRKLFNFRAGLWGNAEYNRDRGFGGGVRGEPQRLKKLCEIYRN